MEAARALLLDLSCESGSARTLRDILESCANRPIQVRHEIIAPSTGAVFAGEAHGIALHFGPNIVFILVSSDRLKQASAVIDSIKAELCEVPILAIVEGGKPEEMAELLRLGVADFVTPPLKAIDILPRLWRLLGETRRSETLADTLRERLGMQHLKHMVGQCPSFLTEIEKVPTIARCDASVLISGETGAGKELVARAIHYLSRRAHKPFFPFSCGAVPVELVENELFGHIRGAFTSADSSRPGLIRECEGGTLFLDEIDCLPLAAQAKLSRFLQEKEYRQLGSAKIQYADVRVIAATNVDLEQAVGRGEFRQDLYYRLNVIPLVLPPLRERRGDIPLLARHFLAKYSAEARKEVGNFSLEALERLLNYEWPGNVRELMHVIERAVVFSQGPVIQGFDIALPSSEPTPHRQSFRAAKSRFVSRFERNYIQELLQTHGGSISKAARAAQKNRRAFWELIRKHKIDAQQFKPNGQRQQLSIPPTAERWHSVS
jgi:two-component system response regulator GlrR